MTAISLDALFGEMRAGENRAFTDRCIREAQRLSCEDIFTQVLTGYLFNKARLFYDAERNLFWVQPTTGPLQVAIWMMPVCRAVEEAA